MHDFSKYSINESCAFSAAKKIDSLVFGSKEYYQNLQDIEKKSNVVSLHHSRNRHHPEFHPNGFKDMSFIDRVEMMIDWKAAARRTKNGDISKSIEINQSRFNYSDLDREWLVSIIKEI